MAGRTGRLRTAAIEPPATAACCRLMSVGPGPAADGSRIRAGSQLVRSAAEGYAADSSARNSVAVGLRLVLDRLA